MACVIEMSFRRKSTWTFSKSGNTFWLSYFVHTNPCTYSWIVFNLFDTISAIRIMGKLNCFRWNSSKSVNSLDRTSAFHVKFRWISLNINATHPHSNKSLCVFPWNRMTIYFRNFNRTSEILEWSDRKKNE